MEKTFEFLETKENVLLAKKLAKWLVVLNCIAIFMAIVLTLIGISFFNKQEIIPFSITLLNSFGKWGLVISEVIRFAIVIAVFWLPKLAEKNPIFGKGSYVLFLSLFLLETALILNGLDALHDLLNILFGINLLFITPANTFPFALVISVLTVGFFKIREK